MARGSIPPRETTDAILRRLIDREIARLSEMARAAGLDPAEITGPVRTEYLRRGAVPREGWRGGSIVVD